MHSGRLRFEGFVLDPTDRQLRHGGATVELNARYLDALILLVRDAGKLVSKDRFLDEVWRGVPVTDEALTQCIKTLRRQLGDDAGRPRFIETVPKHGYRFIAPVEVASGIPADEEGAQQASTRPVGAPTSTAWRQFLLLGGAGTIGSGVAGIFGGLFYGFVGASQLPGPGSGAISILLVLIWLTIVAALLGGAGVSFGIAAARLASGQIGPWSIVGGAAGGMIVGAFSKLLGLDAFNLLLGRSPGDITGGAEGALLGAGVGLGVWLASRSADRHSLRRAIFAAGICGGAIGILIPLLGGRLMGGSLDLLARSFPGSRLRLDAIGTLSGEDGFGVRAQAVTGALEGLLFASCIAGAMILGRRSLHPSASSRRVAAPVVHAQTGEG